MLQLGSSCVDLSESKIIINFNILKKKIVVIGNVKEAFLVKFCYTL